ncbi:MAG: MFS transporter [Solirubrobacterales bacterium]|nr:MFS transporter [Solirubrobacterales bacterium]
MASRLRFLPDFPNGFLPVFSSLLLTFCAVGATLPILPRYVKGPIGGGDVEVGLVIGAYAFAAILARPIGGRFGDRRGRRPVMIAGVLMTAIAGGIYAVPMGIPGLVLTRMLLGVGEGIVFTSGAAWVADLADASNRGRLVGLYGLSIWSGLSIGPLIGEGIFQATGSYDAVWIFCALAPLAALPLLIKIPNDRNPNPKSAQHSGLGSFFPREAIRPGLSMMVGCLGFAAIASFLVLMLDNRGIGHGALAFAAFAISVVVSRFLFGSIPDRIGGRNAAIGAALVEMVGLLLIAVAGSLPVVLVASATIGVGFSLLFPSLALLVLDEVDADRRGAAMGAFTSFFDVGVALGSPLVGIAASAGGYPAAFEVGAVGALLSAAIVATVRSNKRHGEGDEISALKISDAI